MHYDCHRERLGLRCCVCRQLMPARPVRFRGRQTSCQPHVPCCLGLLCGLQWQWHQRASTHSRFAVEPTGSRTQESRGARYRAGRRDRIRGGALLGRALVPEPRARRHARLLRLRAPAAGRRGVGGAGRRAAHVSGLLAEHRYRHRRRAAAVLPGAGPAGPRPATAPALCALLRASLSGEHGACCAEACMAPSAPGCASFQDSKAGWSVRW